jgi:hypothetical protein
MSNNFRKAILNFFLHMRMSTPALLNIEIEEEIII